MTLCAALAAAGASAAAVVEKTADGVVVTMGGDHLRLQVRADNIIRVAYARDPAFFERPDIVVLPPGAPPHWRLSTGGQGASSFALVSTARVAARVDLRTGAVTFLDPAGRPILAGKSRPQPGRRRRHGRGHPPRPPAMAGTSR